MSFNYLNPNLPQNLQQRLENIQNQLGQIGQPNNSTGVNGVNFQQNFPQTQSYQGLYNNNFNINNNLQTPFTPQNSQQYVLICGNKQDWDEFLFLNYGITEKNIFDDYKLFLEAKKEIAQEQIDNKKDTLKSKLKDGLKQNAPKFNKNFTNKSTNRRNNFKSDNRYSNKCNNGTNEQKIEQSGRQYIQQDGTTEEEQK